MWREGEVDVEDETPPGLRSRCNTPCASAYLDEVIDDGQFTLRASRDRVIKAVIFLYIGRERPDRARASAHATLSDPPVPLWPP